MSPTRELAYQIAAEAEQLARFHKLTVQVSLPSAETRNNATPCSLRTSHSPGERYPPSAAQLQALHLIGSAPRIHETSISSMFGKIDSRSSQVNRTCLMSRGI